MRRETLENKAQIRFIYILLLIFILTVPIVLSINSTSQKAEVPNLDELQFVKTLDNLFTNFTNTTSPTITVINVHSSPDITQNWTVRFNTIGKANLTITPIDTTWSRSNENSTLYDLKFIEIKCGNQTLDYQWINSSGNNSVFIPDYSCKEAGFELSKVLTCGKHHLKFEFGSDTAYAHNTLADCTGTNGAAGGAGPCHMCDVDAANFTIVAPNGQTQEILNSSTQFVSQTSGNCAGGTAENSTWNYSLGYTFCPVEGDYNATLYFYSQGDSYAWEDSSSDPSSPAYNPYLYTVNYDTDQNWCECNNSQWNSSSIDYESNSPSCCGDDASENRINRTCSSGVCTSDSTDWGCCDSTNDCAYSSTCYSDGYSGDVDSDGGNEECSSGTWIDTVSPIYSSNITSPTSPATYSYGGNYQFNITWTDAASSVDKVLFEFDNTNYSSTTSPAVQNSGNEYYITFSDLAANPSGYSYKWYANDTSDNWNNTPTLNYVINKATLDLSITGSDVTYPTKVNIDTSESNQGDSDVNYTLFRNDTGLVNFSTTLGQAPSGENKRSSAGGYLYTFNTTSGPFTNWTVNSSGVTKIIKVSKGDPSGYMNLYLNDSSSDLTITYPQIAEVEANETAEGDSDVIYELWRQNTNLVNGSQVSDATRLANNSYLFSYQTDGGANWTSGSATSRTLRVLKGTPDVKTFIDGSPSNQTVTYPEIVTLKGNSSTSIGVGDVTFNLYVGGIFLGSGNPSSGSIEMPGGTHNVIYNTSGGENWTSTENSTLYLIVNKNTSTQNFMNLTIDGTEDNRTVTYPATTNTTGWYDGNILGGITFTLYRNSSPIGSSNPIEDVVELSAHVYNYTYSTLGNENYSSASKTYWLTVNKGDSFAYLALNGSSSDQSYVEGEIANITGWSNDEQLETRLWANFSGNLQLIQNGTGTQQNLTDTSNVNDGSWLVKANISSNENYTSNDTGVSYILTIQNRNPSIQLQSGNFTYEGDRGWGEEWNFSAYLIEEGQDTVNVSLWFNRTGDWKLVNSTNINCSCESREVKFTRAPAWDSADIGEQFFKFNTSDYEGGRNETTEQKVTVDKDTVNTEVIQGDGITINRNGTIKGEFDLKFNDTDRNVYLGGGFNCSLWITEDGSTPYDLSFSNQTNSSGVCPFFIDPDCSYVVGTQYWKAGLVNSSIYKEDNTTQKSYNVKGTFVHNVTSPSGDYFTRGESINFTGTTKDDCDNFIYNQAGIYFYANQSSEYECSASDPDGDGIYNCSWDSVNKPLGWYDLKMNSTGTTNYNSGQDIKTQAFYLESSNSSAILLQDQTVYSEGVTKTEVDTFVLNTTLNNTGSSRLYNANITNTALPAGWEINISKYECGDVPVGENCSTSFEINISGCTSPGTYLVNFTGEWNDPGGTRLTSTNSTNVTVNSTYVLNITEPTLYGTVEQYVWSVVGNFTLNNTGNDQLLDIITQYESGTACSVAWGQCNFIPSPTNLSGCGTREIQIEAKSGSGTSEGVYSGVLKSNATGSISDCSPDENCWKTIDIEINVTNSPPLLENFSVSPNPGKWGETFSYTVDVSDPSGDDVNVSLWINRSSGWEEKSMKTVSGSGTLTWNITPYNKTDVGSRKYKFEYVDLNSSDLPRRDWQNTSTSSLTLEKDDLELIYGKGNNSIGIRCGGSTTLGVRLNDTIRNEFVQGETSKFYLYNQSWIYIGENTSDSNGYSNITYSPTCDISTGEHRWKANLTSPYYKKNESSNFTLIVHGFSNLTNLSLPDSALAGEIVEIIVEVRDANKSNLIENYPVRFYKNNTYLGINYTNANGKASYYWNTSEELDAIYEVKVNITNNSTLYYNASLSELTDLIDIQRRLSLDTIQIDNQSIYRNDTFNPHSTNITVNVTKSLLGPAENATIHFFNNTFEFNNCTTNKNGKCSIIYNISDISTPRNQTIQINATKPGTEPSDTITTWIEIRGKLYATLQTPASGEVYHKTETIAFNTTTKDENSNIVISNTSYYNSSWNLIGSGNTSVQTPWTIPVEYNLGAETFYSNTSKPYYDNSSDSVNVEIWGYSNLSNIYTLPISETYSEVDDLIVRCYVEDFNSSKGIANYPVGFYWNETSIGTNLTTANGNASLTWNPPSTPAYYPNATFDLSCNISDNSTLYYNVSMGEISKLIKVNDNTKPQINNTQIKDIEINDSLKLNASVFENVEIDEVWAFINSSYPVDTENVSMENITANNYSVTYTPNKTGTHWVKIFANDSSGNMNYTYAGSFEVVGKVNTSITQVPQSEDATGITQNNNYTFFLNVSFENVGPSPGKMRNTNITLTLDPGFYSNSTFETCGDLSQGENCSYIFEIDVTSEADLGLHTSAITSNVTWENPDSSIGSKLNSTEVDVAGIPILNITQLERNVTIQHGTSKTTNFTIKNEGNDDLSQIVIKNSSAPSNWSYSYSSGCPPYSIPFDLGAGASCRIDTTIEIPLGESPGTREYTVRANATGSLSYCSPTEDCWDNLTMRVTVPEDWSWNRTPTKFNQTLGLGTSGDWEITINNTGNLAINFSYSVGNGNITELSTTSGNVIVEKQNSSTITIHYYVSTTETPGYYEGEVIISNSSATPSQRTVDLIAYVKDVPPTIDSVRLSSTRVDVNFENLIVNSTISDNLGVNKTWSVITLPNSTTVNKSMNFIEGNPAEGNYSLVYTPSTVGSYSLKVCANDTESSLENCSSSYSFNVIGKTSVNISSDKTSLTYQNITQDQGASFNLNITLNNIGNGTSYFTNVSFNPPSNWTASPSVLNYGNITQNSSQSNLSTITLPKAESPSIYSIEAIVNWTNPDYSSRTNSTSILVNITQNPVLNILEERLNVTQEHNTSAWKSFTINSTGNIKLENISFSCFSPSASCENFLMTFTPDSVSELSTLNTTSINVSFSVPEGKSPGNYTFILNASSPEGSVKTFDTVNLSIEVLQNISWTREPSTIPTLRVGKGSKADLGFINITNRGNVPILLNISKTGNLSSYISTNSTSINQTLVKRASIQNLKVSFTAPQEAGYYLADISLFNSSITPSSLNTTVSLNVSEYKVNILSPTNETPAQEVKAGDSINISSSVSYRYSPLKENISFSVELDSTSCQILENETGYNLTGEEVWNVTCIAPDIQDATLHNLTIEAEYTSENILAYDTESNAVNYSDVTPPTFIKITAPDIQHLQQNESEVKVNLSDNVKVHTVLLNITYPNGTVIQKQMTNTTSNLTKGRWNATVENIEEKGDYDLLFITNDTSSNYRNETSWFEVYKNVLFEGVMKVNQTVIDTTFKFYRHDKPSTSKYLIHNVTTNSTTGNYSKTIHNRTYRLKISSLNSLISLENVSITHDMRNPINFYPVSTDRINNLFGKDLKGFAVKSNLSSQKYSLEMDYSSTNWTEGYQDKIYISKCYNWSYSYRNCSSGWTNLTSTVNTEEKTVSTNGLENFSAYALAQNLCGDGGCQSQYGENKNNCPSDCAVEGAAPPAPPGPAAPAPEKVTKGFSVRTNLIEVELHPGESRTYSLWISNKGEQDKTASLSVTGEVNPFIELRRTRATIRAKTTEEITVKVSVPLKASPGVYTGDIEILMAEKKKKLPVTLIVTPIEKALLDLRLSTLTKSLLPNGTLQYKVFLIMLGAKKELNVTLLHQIRSARTGKILLTKEENLTLIESDTFVRKIDLSKIEAINPGKYYIEGIARYKNKTVTSRDIFEIYKPFWTWERIKLIILIISILASIVGGYKGFGYYKLWKERKARYLFPTDYNKLPKGNINIGKIAETDHRTSFKSKELTTHILSAGATGSGKTVSSMVVVEEVLDQDIPVVVFDPTGQWTGFVKRCEDEDMLSHYKEFDMEEDDTRPYKGLIFDMEDPQAEIDFKKYMKSGEITVFTLNKLGPEEFDQAVRNIVQSIFDEEWEESPELQLLIVFDEVHRLLEKYGGKGGYVALERACREFRKWGIGMIMCSQVLADFKEAIKGNVLTEIQLHTKGLGDIERVRTKYGDKYANRVTKEEVGIGMVQNPKYNKGKPYWVHFRPLYHSPHKIKEKDLKKYKELGEKFKELEGRIKELKERGEPTEDLELELRLGKDKLKTGAFRMAEIYIESLEQSLKS